MQEDRSEAVLASMPTPNPPHEPRLSPEEVDRIRAWHEAAYQGDARTTDETFRCLDREFVVPPQVHPVVGTAEMLGRAVLDEVDVNDRVLDMGTGCGINAILAASASSHVLAVDVNPVAVECARENAARNGVANHVEVCTSDVFSNAPGRFDLIIFDPAFRWFRARDLRELGSADENYAALTTFFREAKDHLTPAGRLLMLFGTSGDIDYFKELSDGAGFTREVVATWDYVRDGHQVYYYVFRLSRPEACKRKD